MTACDDRVVAWDPQDSHLQRTIDHVIDDALPKASPESSRAIGPILIVVVAIIAVLAVILMVRNARFRKRQAELLKKHR